MVHTCPHEGWAADPSALRFVAGTVQFARMPGSLACTLGVPCTLYLPEVEDFAGRGLGSVTLTSERCGGPALDWADFALPAAVAGRETSVGSATRGPLGPAQA